MKDQDIVNKILEGGIERRRAEIALVKANQPNRWWLNLGIKIRKEIMEDAWIEATATLVENIATEKFSFQHEGGIRGFLRTATRRNAFRMIEKEIPNATPFHEINWEVIQPEGPRMDFIDEIYELENLQSQVRKVLKLLREMAPKCRRILERTFLKGISNTECAREMSMTDSNLSSTKFRCIRKIMRMW